MVRLVIVRELKLTEASSGIQTAGDGPILKKCPRWMGLGAAMANDMIEWWRQWPMVWL
jgi:hypothetical protein